MPTGDNYSYYLTTTASNSYTIGSYTIGSTSSYYCYCCNVWCWGSHACSHHSCACQATVVYKYQIICPKCETKMWGQVDETVKCTKCKSKIHVKLAEKKDHDFEVEV